jgi:hypothetical protein
VRPGSGRRRRPRLAAGPAAPSRESGMVTAELAVALPTLLLVLAVGLGAVSVVAGRVRCVDVAAVAARLAARGESPSTVAAQVRALDAEAALTIRRDGQFVTVEVRRRFGLPVVGRLLPDVTVHERLVVLDEAAVRPGT